MTLQNNFINTFCGIKALPELQREFGLEDAKSIMDASGVDAREAFPHPPNPEP